jgi:thiol-disulfide isomerase/thioredoxin
MRTKTMIFLSSLFIWGLGLAQAPIQIKLSAAENSAHLGGSISGLTMVKDPQSKVQNIPTDLDDYGLFSFETHRLLGLYKNYKARNISKDYFERIFKNSPFDTTFYQKNPIKSSVYCISGLKGSKKVIVVDANNNLDFADDQVFEFDTATYFVPFQKMDMGLLPVIEIAYEVYDGKQVFLRKTPTRILPFNSNLKSTKPDANWYRMMTPYFHSQLLSGQMESNGATYYIWFDNFPTSDVTYRHNLSFSMNSAKDGIAKGRIYTHETGDSIALMGKAYFIQPLNLRNDVLTLQPLENVHLSGINPGQLMPVLKFQDLESQNLDLNSLSGKPTIIDFWGSWCGPCIKEIPDLKALWQEYGDKINVLSLAFDDDPEAAKALIKELGMDWKQVILPLSSEESKTLLRRWKIEGFPTMLLLDAQGLVVDKVVGLGGTKMLQPMLESLLKGK